MIQKSVYRLLFVLFALAGSLRMSAQQSSDVSLWIVDSEMSDSTVVEDGDRINFEFDESVGYGLAFNHFWTSAFSTELAIQKYSADLSLGLDGGPRFRAGEFDVTSITAMAQVHFLRDRLFSPYIGGGIARISGEFEPSDLVDEPDAENVDLESEVTWTAAAGVNVRLSEHFALTGEIKFIPWDAVEENGVPEEGVEVDPATVSGGVRFRF